MKNKKLFLLIGIFVAFFSVKAQADSACWLPGELRAYDITMQTLWVAHEASACDGLIQTAAPLRAEVAGFLGRSEQQLNLDRDYLAAFYRRAYGEDWETPLNKSMEREDGRLANQIKQNLSQSFCATAAESIHGLTTASWDSFVTQAEEEQWHEKAGFPACPSNNSNSSNDGNE